MGATKERRAEIKQERHNKWLLEYINKNKFLRDEKFHKNNYWSWAAWDSWAAQGKAGSCPCGCGYYNGTLKNKRAATGRGRNYDSGKRYPIDVSVKLCSSCIRFIEQKIGKDFPKY